MPLITIRDVNVKEIGRWVHFVVQSNDYLSEDQAQAIQRERGRDPMGYNFEAFVSKRDADGYTTSWKCYSSCD